MRSLKRLALALVLVLGVGCGAGGGAGAALAKGWALTSMGVRALGLCDDAPPALIRAIAEADRAEAGAEVDGGKGDASSPGAGDASAD